MAGRFPASGLTAALAAAALLLAGCAGGGGAFSYEPETPDQRELRERAARLQATVGEGALAGAAVGAALGAAVGGASGAFAGARFGRLGGAAAGGYVRMLQAEYADREAVLAAVARDVEATNRELEETLAVMRAVLEERRDTLARLRADAAAGRAEADALALQERRAAEAAESMRSAVAGAERRDAFFREARSVLGAETPAASTARLDSAASDLAARIAAMREIAAAMEREL